MSKIKEWCQSLVDGGLTPQMPANIDAAIYEQYAKHLEAENAQLRARLEKAVELPCIEPMTTWDWDEETGREKENFGLYWQVLYRDKDGEFIAYAGLPKKEAEEYLSQIKGENNDD